MFLSCCSPRSSKPTSSLPSTSLYTFSEIRMPPGSAVPSSRTAMLIPSPNRSPSAPTPAKYVRPYSKGQKNDYRDAEAIAEAVQRPTMKFVPTKTTDQLDLQALHRVRERFVGQRTGIINQIRAFMLERGIAVRQGLRFLRAELPGILATRTNALSPRMLRILEDLSADWRRLDA